MQAQTLDRAGIIARSKLSKTASLVLIAIALAASLSQAWTYGMLTQGFDFFEKWQIGQRISNSNVGTLYSPELLHLHISSPFLYTLVSMFSSGDYAIDVRVFRLLCLASSVFGIIALSRLLNYPLWAAMAAVVIFTYRFQPFLADVRVANVNQLQLGLLALFLLVQSRRSLPAKHFLGGVALGFAIAAKPNLLFVAALLTAAWLVNLRLSKTAAFAAGASVAAAVAVFASSAALGGFSYWSDWLKILPKASDYRYLIERANYAPAMLLFVWTGLKASSCIAAVLFGAAIAGSFYAASARRRARLDGVEPELPDDFLMAAMGCLIYLLSASLVWIHYYMLAIPMILFALRPRMGSWGPLTFSRAVQYALAVTAAILIAELPLRILFSITNPYHGAILMNIGAAILFLLGLWELTFGAMGSQPVKKSTMES